MFWIYLNISLVLTWPQVQLVQGHGGCLWDKPTTTVEVGLTGCRVRVGHEPEGRALGGIDHQQLDRLRPAFQVA